MSEQTPGTPQDPQAVSPAWRRIEKARHPQRPYPMEFIERIFTDFSEIHGDRAFGDDAAVACGMARLAGEEVLVIGNRKGGSTKERVRRNFGMPHPEGYRKALRAMKIAEKFGRPVISLIDLPGRIRVLVLKSVDKPRPSRGIFARCRGFVCQPFQS